MRHAVSSVESRVICRSVTQAEAEAEGVWGNNFYTTKNYF
jgi:hypothetical protein